jgi:hypothetical protein
MMSTPAGDECRRVPMRRRWFPISPRRYEASSLMCRSIRSVVDRNWREVGGSFDLVIGPGATIRD